MNAARNGQESQRQLLRKERLADGNPFLHLTAHANGRPVYDPFTFTEKLEHIFERCMQISPRSEPGGGAGLGLAICKSIVELHSGEIAAHNRIDRSGLVIGFTLPVGGTGD